MDKSKREQEEQYFAEQEQLKRKALREKLVKEKEELKKQHQKEMVGKGPNHQSWMNWKSRSACPVGAQPLLHGACFLRFSRLF